MSLRIVTGEAAAAASVAAETLFLMLYGGPGQEKTTEAVKAFGRKAFFIQCEPGALKPILARGLPVPDHTDVVQTWEDLVAAVSYAAQHRAQYNAVIIDTISTWTAHVYRQLEKKFKGWNLPNAMRDYLMQLRDGTRGLGIHVVMIAHSMPPRFDEKGALMYKGGPLLTPKTGHELFVPLVDSMVRVDTMSTLQGTQRVFFPGGTAWPQSAGVPPADLHLWHCKNRDGYGEAVLPADLGAYLRGRKPPLVGL